MEITYYTDPLCCWSWGMEPSIRMIQYEFEGKINWRYCMGGLLPSWDSYHDPINNVNRPLQMGPVWMHAASVTGMNIDHNLWYRDPPRSSYTACIAFKSAELQSAGYGEMYLRLMREACMLQGINIAHVQELIKLADRLKEYCPGFDVKQFSIDLTKGKGLEAFRCDMNEVRLKNIVRFPTLIFRQQEKASLVSVGYRPYSFLIDVIRELAPGLEKTREATITDKKHWVTFIDPEAGEGEPHMAIAQ